MIKSINGSTAAGSDRCLTGGQTGGGYLFTGKRPKIHPKHPLPARQPQDIRLSFVYRRHGVAGWWAISSFWQRGSGEERSKERVWEAFSFFYDSFRITTSNCPFRRCCGGGNDG